MKDKNKLESQIFKVSKSIKNCYLDTVLNRLAISTIYSLEEKELEIIKKILFKNDLGHYSIIFEFFPE